MKNLKLYNNIKTLFNSFSLKKNYNNMYLSKEREFNPIHGFQLIKEDASPYLRSFLLKEQLLERINNINNLGYMSNDTGLMLKSLIDNNAYNTYIKSVHSMDLASIMKEGIRCLGTTSSQATINPTNIEDISLNNTITKVDDLTILVELIKKHNGLSQGFNAIDGTIIIQIPKATSKFDILYYNSNSNTYNIKPKYIIGFLSVDEKHNVKEPTINNKKISK